MSTNEPQREKYPIGGDALGHLTYPLGRYEPGFDADGNIVEISIIEPPEVGAD